MKCPECSSERFQLTKWQNVYKCNRCGRTYGEGLFDPATLKQAFLEQFSAEGPGHRGDTTRGLSRVTYHKANGKEWAELSGVELTEEQLGEIKKTSESARKFADSYVNDVFIPTSQLASFLHYRARMNKKEACEIAHATIHGYLSEDEIDQIEQRISAGLQST